MSTINSAAMAMLTSSMQAMRLSSTLSTFPRGKNLKTLHRLFKHIFRYNDAILHGTEEVEVCNDVFFSAAPTFTSMMMATGKNIINYIMINYYNYIIR